MSAVLEKSVAVLDAAIARKSDWPTLNPLPEQDANQADPFPFDAMGHNMGAAARAIAHGVQAPDAIAAGSVLAAAALAVQPHANVVAPYGARVPLSLFILTSASSGDRKSAVDAIACSAVDELRKEQARKFQEELKAWEEASREKGKTPPRPIMPCLTTSNATVEGLTKQLMCQSHIGVFSSEGGEALGGHSMRDERKAAGLAFYLKAWDGATIDALRSGFGNIVLLNRRMSMHLLVQPILLRQLLSDPLAGGQGMLARCLIAQPTTLAGTRMFKNVNAYNDPAVVAFNARITELLRITPDCWPDGDGLALKPRDLHLTDDAMRAWTAFYNAVEVEQAPGRELEGARAFASKTAEHALRIAGVLAMYDSAEAGRIDATAMEGGIRVANYYLTEHVRLTRSSQADKQHGQLRALMEWMQEQGSLVQQATILQKSPRSIGHRKKDQLMPLLDELAERGYIRKSGTAWEVRPCSD